MGVPDYEVVLILFGDSAGRHVEELVFWMSSKRLINEVRIVKSKILRFNLRNKR